MTTPILRVRDISTALVGRKSVIQVLTSVDLDVFRGEIIGLVGESGSGKSTLAAAILNLLQPPQTLQSGSAFLTLPNGEEKDLLAISEGELRRLRWQNIAYIPQGSMNVLNPVLTIKRQMTDMLLHHGLNHAQALERAQAALQMVNLSSNVLNRYPHELSGGMLQRVVIATAVTMNPAVIVADEPTTALDVVTQRLILQELMKIRDTLGTTIILISHDMGVMAQVADRIAVMYAGRLAEVGSVISVFEEGLHPYTKGLIASIPQHHNERVRALPGEAPTPWHYPQGCRFHPRCPHAMAACSQALPELLVHAPQHLAACYLYEYPDNALEINRTPAQVIIQNGKGLHERSANCS
ncbi:Oligopeptide transport ATP-binding protein AppD [Candidatus Promineifilum breve]|uniref:Oligopeptide transport ATP-binding protein AppD n=1 Tax=Candidatus Promineifilum breve TaxID=1806508 RepID=A0A160T0H6_9CHLR|nr:ABC transporter ATP-binding protein [Candidatus Promineifilum breve]CUS03266.2 Oligopeptide transport ATP-binding protein AppD [Candidatus Promineifilum breve]